MYFFVFALVTLPFLAAAIRLPKSHRHSNDHRHGHSIPIAKHGHSIPIAKHGHTINVSSSVDIAALQAHTNRAIGYALHGITALSSDLGMDRKFHDGIHRYRRNTGKNHPLSLSITQPRSGKRNTESEPLTSFKFEQYYGIIDIGIPFQQFTGIVFRSGWC
jgi:hypothetical protein